MAGDGQRFCLKWNDFRNSVTSVFEDLRKDGELVDITLCCEGKKVKAHRMMLSACSPYFRDLLKENPCQHPVFFLKDTTFSDLRAVIEFVYNGEVNVTQTQLSSFLKTAEMLQVRGLTGDEDKESVPVPASPRAQPRPSPAAAPRTFPRPSPAPVSRPPPAAVRRPMAPAAPPPPPPPAPAPPINSSAAAAARTAAPPPESPPVSPATKRRRVHSGSGSGSNDGLETSAAASPAPTTPSGSDTAPPPAEEPGEQLRMSYPHGGQVKVEKIDIDIADDDEDDMAALGQVVDYEEGYDSNQSLGAVPVPDPGQVSEMLAAAGPSSDGGAGSMTGGGGGTHTCQVCWRSFQSRASLSAHRLTHEGRTVCPLCSRFLSRRADVLRHLNMSHGMHKDEARALLRDTDRRTFAAAVAAASEGAAADADGGGSGDFSGAVGQ
ncbi:broad-complex core protein isoforms 1/2/3/4/5-like isoform X5 [Amphibalanus amphitrite]|uniref:broad-complex core protein isoforms 1/2/3/4/5-like isoform X5 n=1 Tax=Amphibalanus amphitrite TaxID=1232801 RepID=UPI001C911A84|nr:broad-complex core protein isoforms 1/2/3/4/5-like isoform X5 [Amphibalanus amphitrite]